MLALPQCQPPQGSAPAPSADVDAELAAWLSASQPHFDELLALLQRSHAQRLEWLRGAAAGAAATVWWPFTQHAQLPDRRGAPGGCSSCASRCLRLSRQLLGPPL